MTNIEGGGSSNLKSGDWNNPTLLFIGYKLQQNLRENVNTFTQKGVLDCALLLRYVETARLCRSAGQQKLACLSPQ